MITADFRRAAEAGLAALDAFDAATRSLREALTSLLSSFEAPSAKLEIKELLSVTDIVTKYRVSRRTVLDARRKGHLRGIKPAGSSVLLFDVSAVEEWFAGRSMKLRVVR
jgi:hypothetical protein